jgi:hypothetical protein
MTYSIKLSNNNVLVDVPDGAIDSSTVSLNLVGRNVAGYGFYQNENFVHLLENFSKNTPPDSPLVGQLWYDTAATQLKLYSSSGVWQGVGRIESSITKPAIPSSKKGDLWYNTNTNELKVFDGTDYDLVTTSVPGFGTSRLEGSVILGIKDGESIESNNPVLRLFVDDLLIGLVSKYSFVPTTPIVDLHDSIDSPGSILPGLNLVGASLINGKVDQSYALIDPADGPLTTESFVRTDSSTVQEIQSSIWTKEHVHAGIRDNDTAQFLVKIGNYVGSNADEDLDGHIVYTGTRLVITCAEPFEPIRDVISFDSGLTNKTVVKPLSTVDIGSAAGPFNAIYSTSLSGNLTGTVTGNVIGNINGDNARLDKIFTRNGLTTVVDLTKSTPEHYGIFVGTFVGSTSGSLTGNVSGNVTGDLNGNVTGSLQGDVQGNVTGSVTGDVIGNLKGSVLSSNNQVMINNVTREFVGSLTGNASSASTLAVPRTINGVEFDGSESIVITDTTRLSVLGGTLAGPLTLAADPVDVRHAVTKQYVDNLVQSRPLFFSLDTKGLNETGSGPGSVVEILNALAPVTNLSPLTLCRVASTIQDVTSSTSGTTYANFISVTYITNLSVVTTVNNPTRNNDLVYRVNVGRTSWEYVSG